MTDSKTTLRRLAQNNNEDVDILMGVSYLRNLILEKGTEDATKTLTLLDIALLKLQRDLAGRIAENVEFLEAHGAAIGDIRILRKVKKALQKARKEIEKEHNEVEQFIKTTLNPTEH